jgi:hypothetical protein
MLQSSAAAAVMLIQLSMSTSSGCVNSEKPLSVRGPLAKKLIRIERGEI